jgi:hypothetical protein
LKVVIKEDSIANKTSCQNYNRITMRPIDSALLTLHGDTGLSKISVSSPNAERPRSAQPQEK